MGPNFDAFLFWTLVNWPSRLILSRHGALVATSVLVAGLFAILVAGASVLLRHVLSEGGVVTACSCRDLFSLKLTSRQLIDVATFWSLQLLSRHPDVVATSSLYNCCRDILMLSRPLLCTIVVATSCCCRDLFSVQLMSRHLSPFKLMSQLLQMQG